MRFIDEGDVRDAARKMDLPFFEPWTASYVKFDVRVNPIPWQSVVDGVSGGKRGKFKPKRIKSYERLVATTALAEVRSMPGWRTDGLYRMSMLAYRGNKLRCDLGNLLKPVQDALSGIVWDDDSQCILHGDMGVFLDRENPRLVVMVEAIG